MISNQSLTSAAALLVLIVAGAALYWCTAPWQVGVCALTVTLAFGALMLCIGEER